MIRPLIAQALHSLRHQKLSQDIAYSLGSFVVLAISGIVINIVITGLRDAAALGVFNLAYAVYIVASQFAVWGLQYSVLRHAAFYEDDAEERGHMLMTASVCALVMGVLTAAAVALAEPLFARAFSSEATGAAIRNAALGLAVFPLNKVLVAYLNGLRRMKAFAVLQAVRYLAVMALVAAVAASPWPIEASAFCFFLAEALTVVLACIYIARKKLAGSLRFTRAWIERHYRFGSKGLAAGMFAEFNSRVDVLMIGFFLSDRATGIYSFAAMLVDGVYHVLAMVRINFNPMLVGALRDHDWATAQQLRQQSRRIVLPATIVLSLGLIAAFYVFTAWVMPPSKGLLEGLPSLLILLAGLALICFLVPFDNLLMVSGHPGYQTAQQLVLVGTNVAVAAFLLPVLGIEGAALGTAASYVAGIAVMVFFARRVLGWNLLNNTVAPGR
jgi:O-antigen/teichoic acid export membrane protein